MRHGREIDQGYDVSAVFEKDPSKRLPFRVPRHKQEDWPLNPDRTTTRGECGMSKHLELTPPARGGQNPRVVKKVSSPAFAAFEKEC